MKQAGRSYLSALFGISGLLFLCTYLFVWHNFRIGADDFYFLRIANEKGVLGAAKYEYLNWNSRYFSNFLAFSILKDYSWGQSMILIGLLYASFVYGSIYTCLRVARSFFKLPISVIEACFIPLFLFAGFFYCSFSISDTWFWLCTANTYVISVASLFYSVSLLFSASKNIWIYILLFLTSAYIGGSAGPLALFFMLLLLFCLFYSRFASQNEININKVIVALVGVLLFFLILYSAPGNNKRASSFQEVSFIWALLYNFKFCGIILLKWLPGKLPVIIGFSFIWFFFGTRKRLSDNRKIYKYIVSAFLLCAFICFCYQLPITYKTQDVGAFRTMYFVAVVIVMFFSFCFYQLGRITLFWNRSGVAVLMLSSVVAFQAYTFFDQFLLIHSYVEKYDRMDAVLRASEQNSAVVERLPDSGYLMHAGLSADKSYFVNTHVAYYYGIEAVAVH